MTQEGCSDVRREMAVDFAFARVWVDGRIGIGAGELGLETLLPRCAHAGVRELLLGEQACLPKRLQVREFVAPRRVLLVVARVGNDIDFLRVIDT